MSTSTSASSDFLVFGHRGSPRHFPENTLASFDEALRSGADGFETDLRLLSDGKAILFHDDEWQETEIESLSSADAAARGCGLVSLSSLARYSGRTRMILEVKRSQWEELLASEITSWDGVIVASFDHRTIAALSGLQRRFELGLTTFGRLIDTAAYVRGTGATWFFPNYRFVDAGLVASLADSGVKVVPWTANRESEWARLRDIGCAGVITDLPAEAVSWRQSSS